MAKQKQKLAAPSGKPLAEYVKSMDGEIIARTVRAPDALWERLEHLAEKHDLSVNLACVLVFQKVCDEEGV